MRCVKPPSHFLESSLHSSRNIHLAECLVTVKLACPGQGLEDLLKGGGQSGSGHLELRQPVRVEPASSLLLLLEWFMDQ